MRRIALLMTLVLAVAACGGSTDTASDGDQAALPPATDDGGDAPLAGACMEGEPDCQDIGDPNADPIPLPDAGDEPVVAAGMSVDEVLSLDSIDGPFAVEGFLVVDADGNANLCSALAESFPPQCGGDRLPVEGDVPGLDEYQSAEGVIWSDFPILIEGTWDGTVFTIVG